MILRIPLQSYLEGHEPDEGMTMLVGFSPYVGKLILERGNEYLLKMDESALYKQDEERAFDVKELTVPINVQRFYVLDSDDPDIKKLGL